MTLNEVMKDTADAIREKTGKSELIKPVDFATEIKGITAGGGDNWVYANLEQLGQIENITFGVFAMLVKLEKDGEVQIVPAAYARLLEQSGADWKDIGIDISVKVVMSGHGVMTIAEALVDSGIDINSIPKITKEQFYDLNA